jgi:outer membrane protein
MSSRSVVSAARRAFASSVALALLAVVPAAAQPPGRPTPPPRTTPPAGQVLSLADAVALGLQQNPAIRAAQEGRLAAAARIGQARSTYFPRIDWVTAWTRTQIFSPPRTVSNAPTTDTTTTEPATPTPGVSSVVRSDNFSTAIQGRWLLFDFGKTWAVVDEAKAGLKLNEAELERVRELVVLNVKTAYYQLLQARRLVGVADAQVSRAELNLRSAQGFFEVGTKPKSDVTKAEVEVANARVAQIRARNAVRLAETNLANSLGLEATTPVQVEDILGFEPVPLDAPLLLSEALNKRPELVQAVARVDTAQSQLNGARARFLPDLNATGSYGGSTSDFPLHETWSIGVTLSWNLFEGLFSVYRVRETAALLEAARANYDTLELQVRLEVEQAYIAVIEAAERIGATQKALESAQENLRLAQGRYDAGVGTILDLTDAQLALTNAEADLVRALTDHKVGLANLDRAVGRL